MGMVHAAQQGETPASGEVAKVAKTMKKSDAKDYASTKHKGLPDKVKKKQEALEEINRIRQLAGMPVVEAQEIDRVSIGHVDDEREMLIKQLHQIQHQADHLAEFLTELPENSDFPHWWQAKLTKAGEYITTTYQYLENEIVR